MNISGFDHLNLTVANFEETVDWYRRVFGFELVERDRNDDGVWGVIRSDGGRGETMLCLYERPGLRFVDPDDHTQEGRHGINHVGLRITDEAEWLRTIEREKLAVEPVRWPHSKGWYVQDPTGYWFEVALWDRDRVDFAGRPV